MSTTTCSRPLKWHAYWLLYSAAISLYLYNAQATDTAAGSTSPAPSLKAADVVPENERNPDLKWKMIGPNGELDVSDSVRMNPKKGQDGVMKLKKLNPDGTEQTKYVARADPKMFFGGERFFCEIPGMYKQKRFVQIGIDATVKSDPLAGTVLNVDGAIFGFRMDKNGQTAELVALVDKGSWRSCGVRMMPKAGEDLVTVPTLSVRLDRDQNAWALYSRDILLLEGLPLFRDNSDGRIKVAAGNDSRDSTIIRHIRFSDQPAARSEAFKAATNNKLDLVKAFNEGDPSVHRDELPPTPHKK